LEGRGGKRRRGGEKYLNTNINGLKIRHWPASNRTSTKVGELVLRERERLNRHPRDNGEFALWKNRKRELKAAQKALCAGKRERKRRPQKMEGHVRKGNNY